MAAFILALVVTCTFFGVLAALLYFVCQNLKSFSPRTWNKCHNCYICGKVNMSIEGTRTIEEDNNSSQISQS